MLKKLMVLAAGAGLLCSLTATAAPLNDRIGFGIHGPFLSPMFKGSDFVKFGDSYEPFMMGWNVTFDIKLGVTDQFVLDAEYSYVRTYDDTTATDNQSFSPSNDDQALARLSGNLVSLIGSYYFMPESKVQPYLLAGLGADIWRLTDRASGATDEVTDLALKGGAGLSFWLSDNVTFDIEGRVSYSIANLSGDVKDDYYGAGDWSEFSDRPFRGYIQPSIGFTWYFGGSADEDGDGVSDKNDQCPGTAPGVKVDKTGCGIDSDGDGVFDGLDRCDATPAGAKVNADGCPMDSDNDGVFDGLDKCEGTPEGVAVDEFGCPPDGDNDGVPDYRDKQLDTPAGAKVDADGVAIDSDGDGVPDGIDQCDNTPAGAEVDARGCPYDGDLDGVPDSVDACLNTPIGVVVDSTGCPVVKKLEATETITLHINYASGSFEPDEPARAELQQLAARLYAYPETRIEIAGFTDNVGSDSSNQTLSQKRAQGVLDFLVSAGIAADRMTAVGHGENPAYFVGDNGTAEGRRANRRVEIRSVEPK